MGGTPKHLGLPPLNTPEVQPHTRHFPPLLTFPLTTSATLEVMANPPDTCAHTHTCVHVHTCIHMYMPPPPSQGSTYGPFLFARRARLWQSSVLLFNLREQTEKSLAGPSWET